MPEFALELTALGRPPSSNGARHNSAHWTKRADASNRWKDSAYWTWRELVHHGEAPERVTSIEVVAQQMMKDGRGMQDLGNCWPAVKAAIDGLTDKKYKVNGVAGASRLLLADDSPSYLRRLTFVPPDVCGVDGLRLTISYETA